MIQANRIKVQHDVALAPYTTIGLGGEARFFLQADTVEQVRAGLAHAREQGWPVHILAGGSNTLFADEGYAGLVLHVALRGHVFCKEGDDEWVYATAAAGEPWDDFLKACLEQGLAGIECLSGIPGSVGATPVQNVGAYGQEVGETISSLTALDRESLEPATFAGAECGFAYRRSRFKLQDRGRYVITTVTYRLRQYGRPELRYPELARFVESHVDLAALPGGRPALEAVRAAVLELRRSKSMLVDPADPNSRSLGSFFLNPILSSLERQRLEECWQALGGSEAIPFFATADGVKVSAAWLVERAGFRRGHRRGGVGVSANHCLALVNYGGTTREILELAAEIQQRVLERFGVRLEMEPEMVPGGGAGA